MVSPAKAIVVSIDTPMPRRYMFLRKGDTYKTLNCRKKAHAEGHDVYIVHDSKNRRIGIRVPLAIYDSVQEKYKQTRESRAAAVHKRDKKMEVDFRNSVLRQFPLIPASSLLEVVRHATKKHSGRVARTGKLDLAKKAQLAVRAHIRHRHTDYDDLLAKKASRDEARGQIFKTVHDIAIIWGWTPVTGKWAAESPEEIPDREEQTGREISSNHKPKNRPKRSSPREKKTAKRPTSKLSAIPA
ncbi:hypothetical protein F5Y13DRAFT_206441 [Hypoxylon sp. FL1857]|nr:hypothetical protein F5Y13DRAFT_206441 [Hypoxylon sp. FL1857]